MSYVERNNINSDYIGSEQIMAFMIMTPPVSPFLCLLFGTADMGSSESVASTGGISTQLPVDLVPDQTKVQWEDP